MTTKTDGRGRTRDYKKEYTRDHSSKKSKAARSRRNSARRTAESRGTVSKGDGYEMHHPAGNARGKAVKVTRHHNRSTAQKKKAGRRH